MKHTVARAARGETIPALVATALLAHDLPESTTAERSIAARYVDDSVAAMPDLMRAGVRVASGAVYATLSVMGGRPFRGASSSRQAQLAHRLAGVRLPVLSEFTRLTRGLGLVAVVESRGRGGLGDSPR